MREYLRKSGLAAIIVASIIATAVLPRNISQWVVLVILGVWAIVKAIMFCIDHKSFFKGKSFKREIKTRRKKKSEYPLDFKYSKVQLNHRVTDRLRSLYPKGTWDWIDRPTASFFIDGGSARIKTMNTGDYKEAEVIADSFGRIEINMLTVNSISDILKTEHEDAETEYNVDVKTWYDQYAAAFLTELITDLNSKGTKSILINKKGHIRLRDDTEVGSLDNFPTKNLWSKIVDLLKNDGLKAVECKNNISVGW